MASPIVVADKKSLRRVLRSRRRVRLAKPPAISSPKRIEAEYLIGLRKIVGNLTTAIERDLIPELGTIIGAAPAALRRDSIEVVRLDDFDDVLGKALGDIRLQFLVRAR